MKNLFVWMREYGWEDEGYQYLKKGIYIIKPKKGKNKEFLIRRKGSQRGRPLESGECDCITRPEAFKAGNKLVKLVAKEKRKRGSERTDGIDL